MDISTLVDTTITEAVDSAKSIVNAHEGTAGHTPKSSLDPDEHAWIASIIRALYAGEPYDQPPGSLPPKTAVLACDTIIRTALGTSHEAHRGSESENGSAVYEAVGDGTLRILSSGKTLCPPRPPWPQDYEIKSNLPASNVILEYDLGAGASAVVFEYVVTLSVSLTAKIKVDVSGCNDTCSEWVDVGCNQITLQPDSQCNLSISRSNTSPMRKFLLNISFKKLNEVTDPCHPCVTIHWISLKSSSLNKRRLPLATKIWTTIALTPYSSISVSASEWWRSGSHAERSELKHSLNPIIFVGNLIPPLSKKTMPKKTGPNEMLQLSIATMGINVMFSSKFQPTEHLGSLLLCTKGNVLQTNCEENKDTIYTWLEIGGAIDIGPVVSVDNQKHSESRQKSYMRVASSLSQVTAKKKYFDLVGSILAVSPVTIIKCIPFFFVLVSDPHTHSAFTNQTTTVVFKDVSMHFHSLVRIGATYHFTRLKKTILFPETTKRCALRLSSKSEVKVWTVPDICSGEVLNRSLDSDGASSKPATDHNYHEPSKRNDPDCGRIPVAGRSILVYEGRVTAIIDANKGLYELDDMICLLNIHWHCPRLDCFLRIGSKIKLYNVHVLKGSDLSRSVSPKQNKDYIGAFGCCMRSSIEIVEFGPAFTKERNRNLEVVLREIADRCSMTTYLRFLPVFDVLNITIGDVKKGTQKLLKYAKKFLEVYAGKLSRDLYEEFLDHDYSCIISSSTYTTTFPEVLSVYNLFKWASHSQIEFGWGSVAQSTANVVLVAYLSDVSGDASVMHWQLQDLSGNTKITCLCGEIRPIHLNRMWVFRSFHVVTECNTSDYSDHSTTKAYVSLKLNDATPLEGPNPKKSTSVVMGKHRNRVDICVLITSINMKNRSLINGYYFANVRQCSSDDRFLEVDDSDTSLVSIEIISESSKWIPSMRRNRLYMLNNVLPVEVIPNSCNKKFDLDTQSSVDFIGVRLGLDEAVGEVDTSLFSAYAESSDDIDCIPADRWIDYTQKLFELSKLRKCPVSVRDALETRIVLGQLCHLWGVIQSKQMRTADVHWKLVLKVQDMAYWDAVDIYVSADRICDFEFGFVPGCKISLWNLDCKYAHNSKMVYFIVNAMTEFEVEMLSKDAQPNHNEKVAVHRQYMRNLVSFYDIYERFNYASALIHCSLNLVKEVKIWTVCSGCLKPIIDGECSGVCNQGFHFKSSCLVEVQDGTAKAEIVAYDNICFELLEIRNTTNNRLLSLLAQSGDITYSVNFRSIGRKVEVVDNVVMAHLTEHLQKCESPKHLFLLCRQIASSSGECEYERRIPGDGRLKTNASSIARLNLISIHPYNAASHARTMLKSVSHRNN